MTWYVYMIQLRNGDIYIGTTHDLTGRMQEHWAGAGGKTTADLPPIQLLHAEEWPDRSSALRRERQLKRWSRAKKLALAEGRYTDLKRLARCRRRI